MLEFLFIFGHYKCHGFMILVTNCSLPHHLRKHYHCFLSTQKTITQNGRVGYYYLIYMFLIFYLNHFFNNYG